MATAGAVMLLTGALQWSVDRFLIAWLVVTALVCFVVFKIARRVAFEIIQRRTVHVGEHPNA